MDFRWGAAAEALRQEARAFVAAELTDAIRARIDATGVHHDAGFCRKLAQRRWIAPSWPVAEGGLGLPPLEALALAEELQYAGAPLHGVGTSRICVGVVKELGGELLAQRIVPGFLAGEIVIAQGWTEPECGSDVAAARTRAVRDGNEWVINGAKMFTTNASVADYVLLLTRTDAAAPKHRGLTMFLVPLDRDGIEVRPVHTVSGERTNLTFYEDVRVGDEWRVGAVNEGWNAMTVGLTTERAGAFGGELAGLRDLFGPWAASAGRANAQVRAGRLAAVTEISLLLARRSAWAAQNGAQPGVEGSMAKLYDSEALTEQTAALTDLLGPDGLRRAGDGSAPLSGQAEHFLRRALGATIYAGTSEIQRSIIAERGLGLPRGR
ncbi:MAG TPA: acyl-CoA dehydrogenase family protein [Mycobacteriales bacterium]|jgi:alkylation response protein AidB-like acyl-CoA dehydrogenase|nr:acyl-CoA dehydrogenase family protein [Mycobacteriales bacterium]